MALFVVIALALLSVGQADFAEEKHLESAICGRQPAPTWCREVAP